MIRSIFIFYLLKSIELSDGSLRTAVLLPHASVRSQIKLLVNAVVSTEKIAKVYGKICKTLSDSIY